MTSEPRWSGDYGKEINRIAILLLETWKQVDPQSSVALNDCSYLATFADMAKAIVDNQNTCAEEAEAKLAQIETPEACGSLARTNLNNVDVVLFKPFNSDFHVKDGMGVYATPVASGADLRAENERLREDLKKLYCGYVNSLENGYDRIKFLGGQCDDVVTMEKNDPVLIAARAALNPSEPRT